MSTRERLARLDAALGERLRAIRDDDARRRIALVAAVVVGLALAWVHWTGLIVAGGLVGLTQRRLVHAVAAGLGFGALVVVATLLVTPTLGPADLLALSRLGLVTVATGLVLPAWGATVRGIV